MEGTSRPFRDVVKFVWLAVGVVAFITILAASWIYLQFSIYQHVYVLKAGLDWFAITFYHNYTFITAALFALLLINPKVGHSDIKRFISGITGLFDTSRRDDARGSRLGRTDWALWQFFKWGAGFVFFVAAGGPPFVGPVMNAVMMLVMGFGRWTGVVRVFLLPLFPASGSELVALMPTLEVQYRLVQAVVEAVLIVFIIRLFLRLTANLSVDIASISTRRMSVSSMPWSNDLLAILAALLFSVILGAPYWVMDVETPFVYGVIWTTFLLVVVGWVFLRSSGGGQARLRSSGGRIDRLFKAGIRRSVSKIGAILLIAVLFIQLGVLAFYSVNWNNNYLSFQWTPRTQKEITVTNWAAGLDAIRVGSLTALPTSNASTILGLVRQWDQQAASTTMTKEIGAYNWMALASSEIVFYNQTEYWVATTTPAYPATDWISEHLIYTHASRVMIINTHNGAAVSLGQAFNASSEALIYYGEEPLDPVPGGFTSNIYVDVPGYDEISNQTYGHVPDYMLTGWQKALWFTIAEGQLGFAFSGYPINMLWNRNIFDRVQAILIPGLVLDPAAYIVTDGRNVYYCVQVYIDYPLRSRFAASPYLRFLGVVLVNVEDGSLQGYTVTHVMGVSDVDFLTAFYDRYYRSWHDAPDWLLPQIRYPEQLLGNPRVAGQLDYHFQFHVTDPFVWRSGSQFYERPTTEGATSVQYIPWAVGNQTYFVGMQLVQFQSSASQNLAGVYIAYGGDQLGQIYLYQNPSPSNTFIGPTAAENALNTNSAVRTQETLLPNYRIGSYLLYSVGGAPTYFIAVYTNPGTGGVVTQLPFMTAVNPTTGSVGLGSDAAAAYTSLTGSAVMSPVTADVPLLLEGIASLVSGDGYALVNATMVNFPVQIGVETIVFNSVGVDQTVAKVNEFLTAYGPGDAFGNVVYVWLDQAGSLDIGVVEQAPLGYYEVYYVEVTF